MGSPQASISPWLSNARQVFRIRDPSFAGIAEKQLSEGELKAPERPEDDVEM